MDQPGESSNRPLSPESQDLLDRILRNARGKAGKAALQRHETTIRSVLALVDNIEAADFGDLMRLHDSMNGLVGALRDASPKEQHELMGRVLEALAAIEEPRTPPTN